MNSWGRAQQVFVFLLLTLIACDDESYLLGFQSPDENFKVVYAEFTLPTTSFQVDSLSTSNSSTATTQRLLVGRVDDAVFGEATAAAYLQFFPVAFPVIAETAVFNKITLDLHFDFYQTGSAVSSTQTFNIYALADSLENNKSYFTKSVMPIHSELLASVSHGVSPDFFDKAVPLNLDANTRNNVIDSILVDLTKSYGLTIFDAIRATDSVSKATYRNFSRWRKIFKGLAILPGDNNDKIVGFAPQLRSELMLHYTEGTEAKKLVLAISHVNGLANHSSITINRAGTPLAGITSTYTDYDPIDGMRYVQTGGGLLTRIDMKPVYDYFEGISVKSLNVAELSIVTDQQNGPPGNFTLRAVKPDNRTMIKTIQVRDEAYDMQSIPDAVFFGKHYVNGKGAPRVDMAGDDGQSFALELKSNTAGVATYKGYMANFLQREFAVADKDYIRYFGLLPTSPEFGKSVSGAYFHKDSVKLRIFYTTTIPKD